MKERECGFVPILTIAINRNSKNEFNQSEKSFVDGSPS